MLIGLIISARLVHEVALMFDLRKLHDASDFGRAPGEERDAQKALTTLTLGKTCCTARRYFEDSRLAAQRMEGITTNERTRSE